MKEVSVTEGKKHFTSLIALTEKGELIKVLKRKKPVAVLLPHREYRKIKKIMSYISMKTLAEELKGGAPALSSLIEESRKMLESRHDDGR
ncbi:MAG: type II toxin-antitoxin system Phd/YefM family antitoxin [Candidatus Eremiobacteraeota bacterium]|nr:type II toxin-antitoxin system Phd/YefM family antitoxin [Candidatus Eremiobacteraeota bacterium]